MSKFDHLPQYHQPRGPDWWIGLMLAVGFWGFIVTFCIAMITGAYVGG